MLRTRLIEDEALERPFEVSQFLRLLQYLAPYRKQLAAMLLLMAVASACGLLGPYILKIAIDDYMAVGRLDGLTFLALIFLAVNFISMLCMAQRVRTMSVIGQMVLFKIRQDLFAHIQRLSFTFYDSRPAGKILVRIINDVNSLSDLLTNGIINVLTDFVTLLIAIGLMFSLHQPLALITLTTLPVLALIITLLKKSIRVRWQAVRRKASNMNAYIHESLAGMRVTQAYVREPETAQVFHGLSTDIYGTWMHAIQVNNLLHPSVELIAAAAVVLVYGFGIRFIDQGAVTIGVLVAFAGYVWRFWQPMANLCNFYNSVLMAMASTERIFELMDTEPDIQDAPEAQEMPPIIGAVTFDHVSFHYEPEKPVLKDICLNICTGETLALVGPTGAGKSTMVNLISRFYDPVEGAVRIDGRDLREVTLHSLRSQMGVMLQDSFIFSGTILDNIRYGRLDATEAEVIEAARLVNADEFILAMEKGYHTQVQERGSRLSQGQRQLISFARALLADPRILILDEATSSIDTQTELLVQKGLEQLLKGRTSFVIAHRLSTIRNADRILYIDQGRILEAGSHDALIAQKGAYYDLCQAQYRFLQTV